MSYCLLLHRCFELCYCIFHLHKDSAIHFKLCFSSLFFFCFSSVQTDKKISIEHASHRKFTFPWLYLFIAHSCPLRRAACVLTLCVCVCVGTWQHCVFSLTSHTLLSGQIGFSGDTSYFAGCLYVSLLAVCMGCVSSSVGFIYISKKGT